MSDGFKLPVIRTEFPKSIKSEILSAKPMAKPDEELDRDRPLRTDEMAKALLQGYDCTQCKHASLCELHDDIMIHEKICENFQKRGTIFYLKPKNEKNNQFI